VRRKDLRACGWPRQWLYLVETILTTGTLALFAWLRILPVCLLMLLLLSCWAHTRAPPQTAAPDSEPTAEAEEEKLDLEEVILQAGMTCAVCLEDVSVDEEGALPEGCRLQCGHAFHKECIVQWLTQPRCRWCPSCRAPVRPSREPANPELVSV
jgi:hypothetical protein